MRSEPLQLCMTLPEKKVYDFVKEYIHKEQYPPSIREICDGVGIKSTSSVHFILQKLEDKGYITRRSSKKRAIRIVEREEGI